MSHNLFSGNINTSSPPSGAAGGDLSGTYPNPTVAQATGIFTLLSGMVDKVRVVIAAGAVTVATSDFVIIVNKTSGAATVVNLPASPTTGQAFFIKDGKGDAATNNITITPAAGNIDGASTYIMNTNYACEAIVYNGTEWSII